MGHRNDYQLLGRETKTQQEEVGSKRNTSALAPKVSGSPADLPDSPVANKRQVENAIRRAQFRRLEEERNKENGEKEKRKKVDKEASGLSAKDSGSDLETSARPSAKAKSIAKGTESVKHSAKMPAPDTKNPAPVTKNPRPDTKNPAPDTKNPAPDTKNPGPVTKNPGPVTKNPRPDTKRSDTKDGASSAPSSESSAKDAGSSDEKRKRVRPGLALEMLRIGIPTHKGKKMKEEVSAELCRREAGSWSGSEKSNGGGGQVEEVEAKRDFFSPTNSTSSMSSESSSGSATSSGVPAVTPQNRQRKRREIRSCILPRWQVLHHRPGGQGDGT